ncbi:hypothetical protein vseg_000468 [Gypsophila vaccaria]
MEIHLGLSLSNHHKISSLKELDLIGHVNYGLTRYEYDDNSSTLSYEDEEMNYQNGLDKKHKEFNEVMIDEDSSDFCVPKTLPLLAWDDHRNHDDHRLTRVCNSSTFSINGNEGDEIVGWPPIKTFRKKLSVAHNHRQQRRRHHHGRSLSVVGSGGGCGGSRSTYVKVQMEGCLITRKINLKQYHSYDALSSSLLHMFGKGQDSEGDYKLTYRDGEGDWLLAGDVPWRTFIRSVQRLKMVKREY